MKAPNGAGTVYKCKEPRRKPWRAMASVIGDDGQHSRVSLGYYATKKDGLIALAQFADAPYDIESSKRPFSEIYGLWRDDKFALGGNQNTIKNYLVAFNHASALHEKPMCDIRLKDIQSVMDSQSNRDGAKRVQNLISQMYDFCIKNDILKRNYAKDAVIKQKDAIKAEKHPYTQEELNAVRAVIQSDDDLIRNAAKMVIMLCYSGLRIGEFLSLEKSDTHLDETVPYIHIRDSKTDNGIRDVPIHSAALPFWREFLDRSVSTRTVCTPSGQMMSYDNFKRVYLNALNAELGQSHTAHECRHTFITNATVTGCNPTYIKFIVGHSSMMSLTEQTYTHITIAQLSDEVEKIK